MRCLKVNKELVVLLFLCFSKTNFLLPEIPLNIDSKRLDRAIAIYKGDAPPPSTKVNKTAKKKQKRAKRARSAYSFFVAASSNEWKVKHPDQSFAEFSRFCSGAWKELKDKSEFAKLASEDRKRRERELEEEDDDGDEEEDDDDDDDDDVDDEDDEKGEGEGLNQNEDVAVDRSVDAGPPFVRRVLEREKMPRLRLLCFT